MPSTEEAILTTKAIANRFGVTVGTVRRWVRERRIPAIRASRKTIRFDIAQVEAALRQQVGDAAP